MKFSPVLFTAISLLAGALFLPNIACAQEDQTQKLVDQLWLVSKQNGALNDARNESLIKALDDNFNDLKKSDNDAYNREQDKETESAAMYQLLPAFNALPTALSQTEITIHDIMDNRYRELNRIPVVNTEHLSGTDKSDQKYKAEYLVDSSWNTPVNTQAFDIFMRYFCDPKASAGRLKDSQWQLTGVQHKGSTISYKLGCGEVSGADIASRHSILGTESDDTAEAKAVIGLPLRPSDLFFEPTTFPTAPQTKTSTNVIDSSNVSKMADVYYGAFAQSLQFLLGPPGEVSNDIMTQGEISRKMLASYPFAILFAERAGTMGPQAAQSVATLLTSKLSSATQDPVIMGHLNSIKQRNTIIMAEYMDIVMYQLPTSPGYYMRISGEMSPSQLRREEVWLTAMQTALNYQRNRWLEILAALEAVR